jgi:DNA primase
MVDPESVKAANPLDSTIRQLTGQEPNRFHKIFAPWRKEDTPSVHVYEDGTWWDYGAGKGGDVIDFVGYFRFGNAYSPDTHFLQIVDMLGGLDITPSPAQSKRPSPEKPKLAITIEQIQEWHDTMPLARWDYWRSRGLNDRAISHFKLGWDGMRYTIPGLYRNVPFGIKRRKARDVDDGIDAKYVSVTGSRVGIFNADTLWTAVSVVICEGEIDAMLLEQHGYRAVTTTGGAGTWKDEWAKFFAHIKKVTIVYDNDKAGQDGAHKVLTVIGHGRIVTLPKKYKDVGEMVQDRDATNAWLLENIRSIT